MTLFRLDHEVIRDYDKEFWLSLQVSTQDPENGGGLKLRVITKTLCYN